MRIPGLALLTLSLLAAPNTFAAGNLLSLGFGVSVPKDPSFTRLKAGPSRSEGGEHVSECLLGGEVSSGAEDEVGHALV